MFNARNGQRENHILEVNSQMALFIYQKKSRVLSLPLTTQSFNLIYSGRCFLWIWVLFFGY